MKQIAEAVKTGGLTGQGFSNLLGRPRLGPVALLVREAVQNSWDARLRSTDGSVRFSVRVRNLLRPQEREFRRIFDQGDSLEPSQRNGLARALADDGPLRVLELADFGTVGLSGATRPDLPMNGLESRFVNFFFDVGRSHEESGDGGTYGFGRSSLYTAGKASLILVDSRLADGAERRLMACRIGEAFEVTRGWANKGRYSGRHFWGRAKGDVAQPLIGSAAQALAEKLGLPPREAVRQSGTTVLIPWPVDGFDDGDSIVRSIVHHLWPKMIPGTRHAIITFRVEIDGKPYPVPDPATLDEYRLFVQALTMARTRSHVAGAKVIQTLRPRHTTGYLGVSAGIVSETATSPLPPADDEEETERAARPVALNRVALMRPSELVVRYLTVPGTEHAGRSWAGVFICDDADFVRTAFARAEPPAHDDWIADRLQEKHERYVVRKTVTSLVPDAVRDVLGVGRTGLEDGKGSGMSLAGASDRFAATLLAGEGQGPAADSTASNAGGGGRANRGAIRPRVSTPIVDSLEVRGDARVAVFRTTVNAKIGSTVLVTAKAAIHVEGVLDAAPEGVREPSVIGWSGGRHTSQGCEVTMTASEQDVVIYVQFNDEYGMTLECNCEGLQ